MRSSELGCSVREAFAGDAERIVGLCLQLGYGVSRQHVERHLRTLGQERVVFVAVVPRAGVVGWIGVARSRTLTSMQRADIEGLVVEDEFRGNGIGAMLLAAAERWAQRHGCRAMRLLSNVVRERAHAFYYRLGYELLKTEYVLQKNL